MNCFNCGKEIPDNSNYCQICGALQEKKESCSDIGIKRKSMKKLWFLLIPVIIAVCLGFAFRGTTEKVKEERDSQLLWSIESAFHSAILNLGITSYDSTELTGELTVEMERLLGKTIEDIKNEFVSKVCKKKKLYFLVNPMTETVCVSVGCREGVVGVDSNELFCASSPMSRVSTD